MTELTARRTRRVAVSLTLAGGLSIAIAVIPEITAVGLIGLLVFIGAVLRWHSWHRGFAAVLALLLGGYLIGGRGFAYLGTAPIYVGETVLLLGTFAVLVGGGVGAALRSKLIWALIVFAVICAARTLPFLGRDGVNALRDGALWGYGWFALLVAASVLRSGTVLPLLRPYSRAVPWIILLLPPLVVVAAIFRESLGGTSTGPAVVDLKAGDVAVHLAGAMSFVLLGVYKDFARSTTQVQWLTEWIWAVAWVVGVFSVAALTRAGFLAVVGALGVIVVLQPESARLGKAVVAGSVLLLALVAFNVSIDTGPRRTVSVRQTIMNMQSLTGGDTDQSRLQGTIQWRLAWWGTIVDYTVLGPHFWTGKGFGVHLGLDDGFTVAENGPRSPHNGHLTVLARAGVPAFAAWLVLQGMFCVALLQAFRRARRTGSRRWATLDLWLLAYWTAFMINASFDVFLEGPQGGIWFWSLMGFGIGAIEMQRGRGGRAPRPASRRHVAA